jgi:Ca2+-binding RTX toxin-like protein
VPGGKILVVEGQGVTRLLPDGTIDPAYGRVVVSQSGAGVPAANEWGEVQFTAAGMSRTLALHRMAADNPDPGPIWLDPAGQLFVVGTDYAEEMRAANQNGDLVIMRNHFDISRVFNPADVTLLNFAGLGGNDFITLASAGSIRSTVSGGDGDDKILGGVGADSLSGNAGKDFLAGGSGSDRLAGHGGRDKLIGEGGADRCYGGPSGDWLFGNGGNDQLYGDGGNDQIYGGSGNDTLDGAKGNDFMVSNDSAIEPPGWVDHIWGDGDWDTAVADPDDVLVSIETRLDAMPV